MPDVLSMIDMAKDNALAFVLGYMLAMGDLHNFLADLVHP